ncbi:type I-B CRISPR-associated protein Cas8b/Csh1 (plasmid) [Haloferax mediterranei ATCC 33500]|uniref:CRISPR-associated Csh1 family protein n=1 Tax=Haloferax mediterranei (strain ATCC 33500 / DSM 1411 / JCM 8866 / NBRC 14739 / NCIMB 2177 / R-4) TaxID=523841 RepID=I3RB27_HALMT|nr:type I-B CRISPR-associated protein Cas8b/Csh1 [Haloferax mediterranei]AFK21437.1 CRISPR-associated Csh1 family protein [Haloferax mediterranei ATCC 33500]AHZ24494.1 CRISPR-associated protein Csh1 [Haloferax mediterranei ATCC 33500]ELZ97246.1 CRISPR-associated Csh1 family protein [Haloferax mediterranei ATCC 33500]MDX5990018.1 type I-B CRISPR-associated protein Cas8b/Csh1 [Haloferax mediterranei ATCC 33500]QCQ76892.1 type I-B CRISPR-associated protein Cas8b/Csh1 [Haloferax mediterranei ATCC 
MLSPEEFRRTYPEATLLEELPDRPIASLRDIQYLYGTLYTLATTGGGTYAPYLTPDAAGDLVDEPDSLIVVRVDISGDVPVLASDSQGPVWVTKYTEELIPKVAHCKYPAARGIDHSVTHQAGKNSDPDKLARYAKERLSKWAADSVVQSTAEDHEDGWIIDALAELGENEDTIETLEREVRSNLSGSTTALLTVQVKLDADGPYLWPGDLDVAMAAMRSRKLSKLISKGKASNSAGEATDLITGARTRTVGTAQDPLNYFLGKQLEKFPGFDPDQAWRTHPISEDAAITLMNAETFIDACSYRTFGARVYYLPYFFGKPSVEDTYLLYGILYDTVMQDAEERGLTPIETVYQRREDDAIDDNKLRFYVSAVMPHQMSRFDVFGETMNGRIQYPASLAAAHRDALRTAAFKNDGERTAALPRDENWPLLSDGGLLGLVASGSYFYQTFSTGDDDTDASADDPRIQALVSVLSGDSIPVSTLLESYVDRIIDESGDDEYGFPFFRVASQYAQLCALATAEHDFLEAAGKQRPISEPPSYESRTMPKIEEPITDGGFAGAEKLESFIEDTPALATNDERCASFLLGALVGAVGSYQEYKHDRSTTLVDQFPVQAVTRNRIKKVTESAIEKTITYTRQEKKGNASYPGTKFDYIVDRLRETVIQPDPDDWEIDTADLRFYYALGLTYGMNDRPLGSSIESEQPNPTAN